MIDPKQIPDEAVAAAREALYLSAGPTYDDDWRSALAAALNAWPWAETRVEDWHTPPETVLILPLPKDAADE